MRAKHKRDKVITEYFLFFCGIFMEMMTEEWVDSRAKDLVLESAECRSKERRGQVNKETSILKDWVKFSSFCFLLFPQ